MSGINAAIAAKVNVIATSVPDASALKDPLGTAASKGIEIITVNSGLGAFDSLATYMVHVGQTEDVAGKGAGKQFKQAGAKKVLIVIHEASNSGLQQRASLCDACLPGFQILGSHRCRRVLLGLQADAATSVTIEDDGQPGDGAVMWYASALRP